MLYDIFHRIQLLAVAVIGAEFDHRIRKFVGCPHNNYHILQSSAYDGSGSDNRRIYISFQ